MVANNYQWPSERVNPRRATSINKIEVISSLAAQVNVLTKNLESMTKKLDSMAVHGVHAMQNSAGACEQCGDNYLSSYCPFNIVSAHFV